MRRDVTIAAAIAGTPLAAAVSVPEDLLAAPNARTVKDHRRTAVASVRVCGREVFVKRFKPYVWYRRLESAWVATAARRCWKASALLERAGFAVAPALAMVEVRRFFLPADSYFVTGAVPGAMPAGRLWLEGKLGSVERRRVLLSGAKTLRRLHDAGFYSRDANADNFLIRVAPGAEIEFFLLDLENMRRLRRVSRRRRVKNLVQLQRPVRGSMRRADQVRFVRAYLGGDCGELRRWLAALSVLDWKKEKEYSRRSQKAGNHRSS